MHNTQFNKKGLGYYWFHFALLKKILISVIISSSYINVSIQVFISTIV